MIEGTKDNKMTCKPGVYLFGAGGAATWVLAGFERAGIPVLGFIDEAANPPFKVCGIPVYSPADTRVSGAKRKKAALIVSVMNPVADLDGIMERMSHKGWCNVYSYSEFGKTLLIQNGMHCGILDPVPLKKHGRDLAQVRKILSDEHSKELLDGFVKYVKTFDESGLSAVTPQPYFTDTLPRWTEPLRLVDCGAFDGDTLRAAQDSGYKIQAVRAFEPDPINYSKLLHEIKLGINSEAWPCGVSDKTGVLRFSSQGDTGSALSDEGDMIVQCVALDDAIPSFSPTLVKMDIEGAEEAALEGAENLLRTYSPELAISVYHRPEDIWRIPLWLYKIWGKDARYYLRRHSRGVADTLLYVFPRKTARKSRLPRSLRA
ncbi:MAG: hypothetical protein CVU79_00230 [Elusimicrobia bacterium HGW-Elusimicrobia-3]|nr:MAG: hypothetical protein CVU79_00230 [Elusimicrobia bacterium HGW-Elusimicrobia-3]